MGHTFAVPGRSALLVVAWAAAATTTMPTGAVAQAESLQQHVATLKQSLAESQQLLRQYEWIETTAISLNGEEKSRQQKRCYYGADGVLQKVPVSASAPEERKRGLRGRIAAKKKEDLAEYLDAAAAVVRSYVPPDPAKLEASKVAGKVSADLLEPGKRARVNFRDYAKPGDNLGLELDVADNRLLGLTVSSYMEDAKDVVNLDARLGLLDNGASYPKVITLDAPAKNTRVTVENSGYRRVSP